MPDFNAILQAINGMAQNVSPDTMSAQPMSPVTSATDVPPPVPPMDVESSHPFSGSRADPARPYAPAPNTGSSAVVPGSEIQNTGYPDQGPKETDSQYFIRKTKERNDAYEQQLRYQKMAATMPQPAPPSQFASPLAQGLMAALELVAQAGGGGEGDKMMNSFQSGVLNQNTRKYNVRAQEAEQQRAMLSLLAGDAERKAGVVESELGEAQHEKFQTQTRKETEDFEMKLKDKELESRNLTAEEKTDQKALGEFWTLMHKSGTDPKVKMKAATDFNSALFRASPNVSRAYSPVNPNDPTFSQPDIDYVKKQGDVAAQGARLPGIQADSQYKQDRANITHQTVDAVIQRVRNQAKISGNQVFISDDRRKLMEKALQYFDQNEQSILASRAVSTQLHEQQYKDLLTGRAYSIPALAAIESEASADVRQRKSYADQLAGKLTAAEAEAKIYKDAKVGPDGFLQVDGKPLIVKNKYQTAADKQEAETKYNDILQEKIQANKDLETAQQARDQARKQRDKEASRGSEGDTGATRSVRNNNPGNIKATGTAGRDAQGFAVYKTLAEGEAAQRKLWESASYRNMPLERAIRKWSGNGYGAKSLGVDGKKTFGSLTESQKVAFLDAQRQAEGWKGGASKTSGARQIAKGITVERAE